MNKFICIGNIVREVKCEQRGEVLVLNNCVAVKYDKDQTDFIDFAAFGKTATLIEKWWKKGDKIGIEGKLRTNTWTGQDGKNHKSYFVQVEQVEFLQDKRTRYPAGTENKEDLSDLPF